MGSALLTEMSPPLCDALLDLGSSAQMLREIAADNLFTLRLDSSEPLYQYHQLFREFLVARFQQEDRTAYRQLRMRQADLMIHRGRWPQAIESYISAEAYAEAARAVEIVAQDTFDAGQWEIARDWIDAIPEAVKDEHPRLLFYRGKLFAEMGHPVEALQTLKRTHTAYLRKGDEIGGARTLVQQAVAHRFQGRLSDAIESCRGALEVVGERDAHTAMDAHRNIGICLKLQGKLAQGLEEMARALQLAKSSGDDANAAFVTQDMGATALAQGRLVEARKHYHLALLYWRKLGNPSALSMTLQGLGLIDQYLGQYIEAESRLQESLTKARLAADARIEAYALVNLGDLYRDVGAYLKAHAHYEEAQIIAAESRLTLLLIYLLIATGDVCRLQGNLEHAQQLLVEAADQVNEEEMPQEAGLCRLALGAVSAQQGTLRAAHMQLGLAANLFERIGSARDLARAHLHLASLTHAEQHAEETCEHLRKVATLAESLGTHQFIVAEGPGMLDLLQYAESCEESDTASAALWARASTDIDELFISGPTPAGAGKPSIKAAIELLALQGGQVLRQGQPVTHWESEVARVMAYLFASHPQGLTRDRATEMLWPEVGLERGNSLFHSTLYRLRQALGKEFIIRQDGLFRVNPDSGYRFDASEFEGLSELGRGDDGLAHISRLQAIAIYRSPFLETCDHDWCSEIRMNLATTMSALLLKEAQYQAGTGALQKAEELYARLLRFDPLDERAHRGIMWCRAKGSDRSGALRQLRECHDVLQQELGVDPSPETLALGDALIDGDPGPPPD